MITGTKLKVLREKKRLSQEELAHAVGVSQTTIGNWEQGKSIRSKYISKLAEALSTPIDNLLLEMKNTKSVPLSEMTNDRTGFEFTIKAPNTFFEELNNKLDFLVTKFNQNPQ